MDKQQKEKFKKEQEEKLNEELEKLNREMGYLKDHHEKKMQEMQEKIDLLNFQKEILAKYKI